MILLGFIYGEEDDDDDGDYWGGFYCPNDRDELSRLGNYIGDNTHLEQLFFDGRRNNGRLADAIVGNGAFFDGLKRNTSIKLLVLIDFDFSRGVDGYDFSGGAGHEILNEYVLNNANLDLFGARHCNLSNGGAGVLGSTLSTCRNVGYLRLEGCNIDDDILNELIAGGFTGMSKLLKLGLSSNTFGVSECRAIATLLQNSCCNLKSIDLKDNGINDECATTLAKA